MCDNNHSEKQILYKNVFFRYSKAAHINLLLLLGKRPYHNVLPRQETFWALAKFESKHLGISKSIGCKAFTKVLSFRSSHSLQKNSLIPINSKSL